MNFLLTQLMLFSDPKNEVYLSTVSAWKISVKYRLGKLALPLPPDKFIPEERKRIWPHL